LYQLRVGLLVCAAAAALPGVADGQQAVRVAEHLGPVSDGSPRPTLAAHAPGRRRATVWHGTVERNPSRDSEAPPYVVVDHAGLKRRYIRAEEDADLEPFVGREVTVLADTGLLLDLDQIELRPAESPDDRFEDAQVETAAYEDPPPAFRPGDPTVSGQDTSAENDAGEASEAPAARVARGLERIEELPLTTASGQPLVAGEDLMLAPGGLGGVCPTCGKQHGLGGGCACGARGRFYARAEYLHWWTDGFFVPPLVTTSPAGTPQVDAGVLGESGTTILFGNSELLDGPFNGGRLRAGWWFRGIDKIGVEGDYLILDQDSIRYSIFGNNGSPIIGRPFFNVLTGAEDSSLVAFPNLTEGAVTVDAASDLQTGGLRLRIAACCNEIPAFGNAVSRVDFLAGYRYSQLDEQLRVFEDSTSLDVNNPGDFIIRDSFATHNQFHGGEAGVVWEWDRPRWSLELIGRVALGTNQQDVFINGNTVVSDGQFSLSQTGGILAQRSNIGHYERNRFSVIPELSATIAFKVTQRLRLTAGYTFFYWSQVVRPGDQIDLDLNPNLFPPEANPFSGALRPRFVWQESDYWAHGATAGIDFRW
jgi:hypothetical protein